MAPVYAVIILCLAAVLAAMIKSGKFFRAIFSTALQGIAALAAVNAVGLLTGITLAVNRYTLTASAIFGMPGVITLTVLKFIFR